LQDNVADNLLNNNNKFLNKTPLNIILKKTAIFAGMFK